MKFHFAALTLAAALTAAPAFAQQGDKPNDSPKSEDTEKSKAVKPEHGSVKAQEANQEKVNDKRDKNDARDSKIPQSDQEPGVRNPERQDNDAKRAGDRDEHKQASEKDRSTQYHFKSDAREKARAHYKAQATNHNRTVTIVRQQVIPVEVQTRIEPVPVDVVNYLGPAPEGFQYGYVDGYVLVYDPATYFVVDVIDLF
jgi:type IV secretory pathway VirB10-like protein